MSRLSVNFYTLEESVNRLAAVHEDCFTDAASPLRADVVTALDSGVSVFGPLPEPGAESGGLDAVAALETAFRRAVGAVRELLRHVDEQTAFMRDTTSLNLNAYKETEHALWNAIKTRDEDPDIR